MVQQPPSPEPAATAPSASNNLALLLAEINSTAIRLRQRGRPSPNILPELPGAEQAVLEIIGRSEPITVPQIARERSTSRQNIQILVDRLAAQGRVEFSTNPAHKRSALVALTQAGKRFLEAGALNQKQLLAQMGSSLSPAEIDSTVGVLRRIQKLLSDQPEVSKRSPAPEHTRLAGDDSRPEKQADAVAPEEFPVSLL